MNSQKFEYTFQNINDENIINMFNSINLNIEGYIFASLMPKLSSYALFGSLTSFSMRNVILAFDRTNLYFFELSRLSNKNVEELLIVPLNQILNCSHRNILFGVSKKINLKLGDNNKFILQANNKLKNLNNQKNSLLNLINLLEVK